MTFGLLIYISISVPPLVDFRSAILNAGYRVSFSHCHPLSIKTDAPPSVIWDLLQGKHFLAVQTIT